MASPSQAEPDLDLLWAKPGTVVHVRGFPFSVGATGVFLEGRAGNAGLAGIDAVRRLPVVVSDEALQAGDRPITEILARYVKGR